MFIHKQMEIDRNFVKSSMLKCFSCFLGTKLAEYLMNKCGCQCLIKQVTQQAEDLRPDSTSLSERHKRTMTMREGADAVARASADILADSPDMVMRRGLGSGWL